MKTTKNISILEYFDEESLIYHIVCNKQGPDDGVLKEVTSLEYTEQSRIAYLERFGKDISAVLISKMIIELLDENLEIIGE